MVRFLKENLAARMAAVVLAGLLAAAIPNLVSRAASISLNTGPSDPSQGQVTLNQLIQAINTGVTSMVNSQYTAAGNTADTNEDTLYTYTLPANTLKTPGQTLHIHCWGATKNNGDNKTMNLYFGASEISTPTAATNNKGWELWLHVTRGINSTTQVVVGTGIVDTTPVTPFNAAGTDDMTTALTIKCTGQAGAGTANDVAGKGMTVELSQ